MCDTNIKEGLRNGAGGSMEMQSKGIAELMESSDKILAFLHQFKAEMLAYIDNSLSVHANSCGAARAVEAAAQSSTKAPEKNSLKLAVGKFLGFEAQGKAGMVISAIFWIAVGAIIAFAIVHINEISQAAGKVGVP